MPSHQDILRLRALRLALRLSAGLVSASTFAAKVHPVGDAHAALAWLRAALAPLADGDRFMRTVLRDLDPEATAPWSSPRAARRALRRLAAEAQQVGARLRTRRTGRAKQSRRGP